MKGNDKVVAMLNDRLAEELTAINQYMVHAEMCEDWGYSKLHEFHYKRSIDEMKHAEKLIERILFLEGKPTVSVLNKINIGDTPEKQINNDHDAEIEAIELYNDSIKLAADCKDFGTKDLLESILKDEESHLDDLEARIDQIGQIGIQNYLVEQIG